MRSLHESYNSEMLRDIIGSVDKTQQQKVNCSNLALFLLAVG